MSPCCGPVTGRRRVYMRDTILTQYCYIILCIMKRYCICIPIRLYVEEGESSPFFVRFRQSFDSGSCVLAGSTHTRTVLSRPHVYIVRRSVQPTLLIAGMRDRCMRREGSVLFR
jgi:hypothetical protein